MKLGQTLNYFLGDHEGLGEYNDSYGTKNVNEIRHILAANSNTASLWELGLRNHQRSRINTAYSNFNRVGKIKNELQS